MKNPKQLLSTGIVILILLVSMVSCGIFQSDKMSGRVGLKYGGHMVESEDSPEYELVIIDHGFDSWLLRNGHMRGQHENTYLQNMNSIYANTWNRLYVTGNRRVESYVDYDTRIDYGSEFNYKLFMYFKYFEEVNKMDLRTGRRR